MAQLPMSLNDLLLFECWNLSNSHTSWNSIY